MLQEQANSLQWKLAYTKDPLSAIACSGLLLFAIMMDSLTEHIRKEPPWQTMFADDVVLCAREKDVLELEMEQWMEALEKRGKKVSRAKTEYKCLN